MKPEPKPITHHHKAADFVNLACISLNVNARLRDKPDGERSAERAAAILSAWTGMTWNEADVWRCLLAVKLSREIQGDFHADDYVDIAGFAALLGEQQSRQGRKLVWPEDVLTESRECKACCSLIHPSELEGMV